MEFIEPIIKLSKENDADVKKQIKSYKSFEFDIKMLKILLREKKELESPTEFVINLNGEKTSPMFVSSQTFTQINLCFN
jgi:hypothetical protein